MGIPDIDILSLTPDERLELLERLRDSLVADPAALPLSDAQRAELDRRLDHLEQEGSVGLTWEETLRQARSTS